MNKDNKILLLAFFIIIGAVISSSIESITGRVVNKKISKISVSPSKTYAGEKVYITVVPGEHGVNEDAIIFNSNGVKLSSINICSGAYRCKEPVTTGFIIPNNFEEGDYQIKVYDYALKDFINGDLTIKGGI